MCAMVSHFNMQLPKDIFIYSFAICTSSLGEVSALIFYPLSSWLVVSLLLSFKSSLYISDTSPLSDMSFASILPSL